MTLKTLKLGQKLIKINKNHGFSMKCSRIVKFTFNFIFILLILGIFYLKNNNLDFLLKKYYDSFWKKNIHLFYKGDY